MDVARYLKDEVNADEVNADADDDDDAPIVISPRSLNMPYVVRFRMSSVTMLQY
jgi:hypothetical protein